MEKQICEWIIEGLQIVSEEEDEYIRVETYEDAGVMTYDDGLVVRLADGQEYQVTIIRSR